MDAISSGGRDNATVLEVPSLIVTSNDRSNVESPVFRLPTELTTLIFQYCSSRINHRLLLTHVCRGWRCIAINNPSLWTDIHIQTSPIKPNARLDYFSSFLAMQLDRTGNLLLDVKWIAKMGDEFFVATLKIIREKAPFSRWRSLLVHISPRANGVAPWFTDDRFTSLESLMVLTRTENTILSVINRTVTPRLKVLEVTWNSPSAENIATSFTKPLTLITSLRLDSMFPYRYRPFLPANVVSLELATALQHLFPHIQTYTLRSCVFIGGNTVDLRNMTTLVVRGALTVRFDCHALLPALRELKLGGLTMEAGAKIEAPVLDILYFMTLYGFGVKGDTARQSHTDSSLQEDGYHLSPNISVIADSYLPSSTVLDLLAKSPKVSHATLRFNDWTDAQAVLGRLFQFEAKNDSPSVENVHLCPRLSELRLDFHWEFSQPSVSEEWLINALKARKESGSRTPLSIYAGWKGEGTYVLLTGD